ALWSHPYSRWSMKNLSELPLTRLTGATRGMESPVINKFDDRKGLGVFFTAPEIPLNPPLGKGEKSERLYSMQFNTELKPEILWSIESPSNIDAVSTSGEKTLIRIRAGNEILSIHSNKAKIESLGKTRLIRDAPQPLVLKDGKGQTQIIVADPMDQVGAWVVEEGKPLKKIWQQKGRAMTTSVPSMLGLTAGDVDGDGIAEVLCIQEMPQGDSRIVAVGLDGTERWHYDFPDFNGRPPVWNETGTTLWALGHFSDPNRLDMLVSNRRSIMHSDETVVINTDKGIIWKKDVLEVREPWTDTPWKHTRGYGGGVVGIADFDGDGLDDIAMCYPAEYSIVKGSNSEQLGIENTGPLKGTDNFWVIGGSPLVADFNNDGKPETLWASSPIIIAFFHDGIKTDILWRTEPNDGATGLPAFGDTDGDGRCEIGLPGFKDGFRCIDPATGQTLWNVPQQGDGSSNCVAVDINGDGIEEFVFANGSKLLAVAKRNSADPILWQIDLPSAIQNIVIDDIDGDDRAEILAGGRDGILYCIKGD
ncbi:MAG: VCBS repeat-containing protein, partial [Candidatus Poribacteria bacterium]